MENDRCGLISVGGFFSFASLSFFTSLMDCGSKGIRLAACKDLATTAQMCQIVPPVVREFSGSHSTAINLDGLGWIWQQCGSAFEEGQVGGCTS